MKVYLVFRLKDSKARKKEYVVDSVYTSPNAALTRIERLCGVKSFITLLNYNLTTHKNGMNLSILRGPNGQQCYMINKTIKGLITTGLSE